MILVIFLAGFGSTARSSSDRDSTARSFSRLQLHGEMYRALLRISTPGRPLHPPLVRNSTVVDAGSLNKTDTGIGVDVRDSDLGMLGASNLGVCERL